MSQKIVFRRKGIFSQIRLQIVVSRTKKRNLIPGLQNWLKQINFTQDYTCTLLVEFFSYFCLRAEGVSVESRVRNAQDSPGGNVIREGDLATLKLSFALPGGGRGEGGGQNVALCSSPKKTLKREYFRFFSQGWQHGGRDTGSVRLPETWCRIISPFNSFREQRLSPDSRVLIELSLPPPTTSLHSGSSKTPSSELSLHRCFLKWITRACLKRFSGGA